MCWKNILFKLRYYGLYLSFGILTTLINLYVYKICLYLGLHYIIAAIMAFIISVFFAFVTNRKYIFKTSHSVVHDLRGFFLARFLTLTINVGGLMLLVQLFGFGKMYSQIFMNGIIVVLNYLLSKYLVFGS